MSRGRPPGAPQSGLLRRTWSPAEHGASPAHRASGTSLSCPSASASPSLMEPALLWDRRGGLVLSELVHASDHVPLANRLSHGSKDLEAAQHQEMIFLPRFGTECPAAFRVSGTDVRPTHIHAAHTRPRMCGGCRRSGSSGPPAGLCWRPPCGNGPPAASVRPVSGVRVEEAVTSMGKGHRKPAGSERERKGPGRSGWGLQPLLPLEPSANCPARGYSLTSLLRHKVRGGL